MKKILPALLVLSLVLAACSGETEATGDVTSAVPAEFGVEEMVVSEDTQIMEVSAFEFGYELSASTFQAGEPITIVLSNDGKSKHDFVIEGTDSKTSLISAGETETIELILETGTYTYHCSVPGHRSKGMEGTFTIE